MASTEEEREAFSELFTEICMAVVNIGRAIKMGQHFTIADFKTLKSEFNDLGSKLFNYYEGTQ